MNFNSTLFIIMFSAFFLFNQAFSAETGLVSEKTVQNKIKTLENNSTLDDKVKNSLSELYTKILDNLSLIKSNEQQSQNYINARKQAPEDIKLLEKKLAALEKKALEREKLEKQELEKQESQKTTQKKTPIKSKKAEKVIPLAELEQQFSTESANLAAVEAKGSDLSNRLSVETGSATGIRKRLIEANQILEQSLEDKKLPLLGGSTEYQTASKWHLDSHIAVLRSEIKMLDQRLLSQPLRLTLLKLKQEKIHYDLLSIRNNVQFLEQQVDLQRSLEIKKTEEITRKEQSKAEGKHELIQSLARSNTQLSENISNKTRELSQLENDDDEVLQETTRLIKEMGNTRKKLEIAGLSQILGQMLLEQKRKLPDSKRYKKHLKERQNLIAKAGLQHLQYQEELSSIKDTTNYLSHYMKSVPPDVQAQIRNDIIDLAKTRKKILIKAISIDESYLKAMNELDFAEKKLIIVANDYAQLLDKHLFWLRNAPLLNIKDIINIPQQTAILLSPSKWVTAFNDLVHILGSSVEMIVALVVFFALIFKLRRLKELLINTGKKTRRITSDSLTHTFKAIFYTLLMAIPIPFILSVAGWQLNEYSGVSHNVSVGIRFIAFPLFCLLFIRYLCLPGGVAEIHFKWPESLVVGITKEMRRLMFTLLPALFITAVLISKSESAINSGLGRVSLLVTLLTLAIFFYRLFKPKTGCLQVVVNANPDGLLGRYQMLWYFISLMSVINLMGLTIAGYIYTAGQMAVSLLLSMWFIWGLVILQQISVRWLLVTQRKYALQQAYEKRAALLQNLKNTQDEHDSENKEQIIDVEEPEIDLVLLSEESTQLLNMILFIIGVIALVTIWIDVLPAFGIFEQVELWHHKGVVDGIEKLLPVTLGDLALAFLITVISIIAAKRLPAIIEIILLQNTRVSSGSRYTITTLINYTIVGIGFFSVFNILGADWARFQWLFAALSVGIGFGLQEIVANFISGIIILFERPIRVGDYVSVGENEGVVSKIQIRATTILTRDRKELLVPNKQFITEQLLNWSLSDSSTRLKVPVGVAYGSDIPRARELLLEAAQENERVLYDPMPRVIFYNFGDNSLDLQLRCFIADVDFRLQTISELNEAINEKFNTAEISIAFPQRDVHLDINQPIDIHLKRE